MMGQSQRRWPSIISTLAPRLIPSTVDEDFVCLVSDFWWKMVTKHTSFRSLLSEMNLYVYMYTNVCDMCVYVGLSKYCVWCEYYVFQDVMYFRILCFIRYYRLYVFKCMSTSLISFITMLIVLDTF